MGRVAKKAIPPLPRARKEAEITGRLLRDQPLIEEQATEQVVLEKINSVGRTHFTAHGNAKRGEIILAPSRAGIQLLRRANRLLVHGR